MKKLFIISTITTCLLFFSSTSQAEAINTPQAAWIRVSPVILPLPLIPGKKETYILKVQNLLTSPLPLRVRLNDFEQTTEDGGYSFSDSTSSPLLSWITLNEKEFILNAGETKKVTLTIQSPKTITAGGYYGMVFFEPVLPQSSDTKVATRVGVLMLGSIGFENLTNLTGKILDFKLGFPFKTSSEIPFLLRVTNTSLRHFSAKPKLTLTSLFGATTFYNPAEKIIFPGKIRRWEETINQSIQPGIYMAEIAVSTGNGNQIKEKTYFLYMPLASIIGIAALIIIINSLYRRKQILRFFKILIYNK